MLEDAGSVCEAGDYRVRKSVEGLTFEIAIDRNPPGSGGKRDPDRWMQEANVLSAPRRYFI